MCDPVTMMTAGASILSTALNVTQQMQHAASQRGDYNYLAAQQRNEADVAESRARQAEAAGEADADKAREKASLLGGKSLARLAAQGTDLLRSPIDVLGDIAASGQADALSLRYEGMRDAWGRAPDGRPRRATTRRQRPTSIPRSGSCGRSCPDVQLPILS